MLQDSTGDVSRTCRPDKKLLEIEVATCIADPLPTHFLDFLMHFITY